MDVFKVINLSEHEHVEREVLLVKVRATGSSRDELKRLADIFRGQIVDVTTKSYTIQLTGTKDKLDAFVEAVKEESTLLEIVRSGLISLPVVRKIFSNDVESAVKMTALLKTKKEVMIDFLLFILNEC